MKLKNSLLLVLFHLTLLYGNSQSLQPSQLSNKLTSKFITKDSMYFELKPGFFSHLAEVPDDLFSLAKSPFKKNNWMVLAGLAASTAVMVNNDRLITEWVMNASEKAGLEANTSYKEIVKFGNTRILKIPLNLNTAFYQIGEGGTSLILASGLWIAGKIKHNPRDIQTAYDLTETFVSSGIVSQIFKRVSGRESPFKATVSGGRWRPFPSFSTYQNNTSSYDAFPSGHLTTLTATFTVLHYNYPEKKWIAPLGVAILAMSSWAMINTEVHWISDYPLALAFGYITGKATSMRHIKKNSLLHINPLNP